MSKALKHAVVAECFYVLAIVAPLAATSIAAAGCAAVQSSVEPVAKVHKEEITGSRIPRAQGSAATSQRATIVGPDDYEPFKDAMGIGRLNTR